MRCLKLQVYLPKKTYVYLQKHCPDWKTMISDEMITHRHAAQKKINSIQKMHMIYGNNIYSSWPVVCHKSPKYITRECCRT